MNAVNDSAIADYLDSIDHALALWTYDLWRRAYSRGLVSAAELSRFLIRYDRETAVYYIPALDCATTKENS